MNMPIRHIEYLLMSHDCVVIPGLGAILASSVQSTFVADREQLLPPCRRFAFNAALTVSDGLLISSISRGNNVLFDEASRMVVDFVDNVMSQLDESGEYSLGRIGRLEMSFDRNITFVPYNRDMISPLADWLPVVAATPVGTLSYQRAEIVSDRKRRQGVVRAGRVRRFVRNTIGAAAAILIGIAVSTPVSVDNVHEASLSIPPVHKVEVIVPVPVEEQPEVVVPETKPEPVVEKKVESKSEPKAEKQAMTQKTAPVKKEPKTNESVRNVDTDDYIVVVGSLTSMADAEKYIARQRRANASLNYGVVVQGNRYRVYAATGATVAQARAMTETAPIARQFKGAWVTHR